MGDKVTLVSATGSKIIVDRHLEKHFLGKGWFKPDNKKIDVEKKGVKNGRQN